MTTTTEPPAIRLAEVARRLGVSKRTVQREIAAGRLRSIRIGRATRVLPEEMERYRSALMAAAEKSA